MNTLGDVIKEAQGLLGDSDDEWVTRDYIVPFIGTVYRLQTIAIKIASGRNLEQAVEVLALAPGQTSLYPQQATGQPLVGLVDPLQVWWKTAGATANFYREAYPKETLPFVAPPGALSFPSQMYWTWRGNKLLVTPMGQAIDVLVDGRFNPPPLKEDTDVLVVHPDMQSPCALAAAALAGVERSNPAVLQAYALEASAAIDTIGADLIKQKQRFSKRLGKQAPRSSGWYWS